MSTNVFVSYSHADAPLVGPVVQLLRANRSLVFQDVDSIRPGQRWRGEIQHALADAGLVLLFWCDHASHSEEVAKEWRAAVDQGKDVLPLLLDATPLPAELGEFQWIDFRSTVGTGHGQPVPPSSPGPAPVSPRPVAPRGPRHWLPLAAVTFVFVGAAGLSLMVLRGSPPAVEGAPTGTPALPPPPPQGGGLAVAAGLAFLVLLALALVVLARRRARRRLAPAAAESTQRGEVERRIAGEVEAEILRRVAPPRPLPQGQSNG